MLKIKNIQEIAVSGLKNGMSFRTNPNSDKTYIFSSQTKLSSKNVYLVTYEKEFKLKKREMQVLELVKAKKEISLFAEIQTTYKSRMGSFISINVTKHLVALEKMGLVSIDWNAAKATLK